MTTALDRFYRAISRVKDYREVERLATSVSMFVFPSKEEAGFYVEMKEDLLAVYELYSRFRVDREGFGGRKLDKR